MKKQKRVKNAATYVILAICIFISALPLVIMVAGAFKDGKEFFTTTSIFPKAPTTESFERVITGGNIFRYVKNSAIISLCTCAVVVSVASLTGYVLSRYKGGVFSVISTATYAFQMVPAILLLVPLFVLVQVLRVYDTIFSMVVVYSAFNLPLSIWVMKGFFDTIPFDIEESAMIDGAGRFKCFWNIVLPLAKPGAITSVILCFTSVWNEYMLGSLLLKSEANRTITYGISQFIGQYSAEYTCVLAAATIASIPTLLILIFAQKYIVAGLSAGAVKG